MFRHRKRIPPSARDRNKPEIIEKESWFEIILGYSREGRDLVISITGLSQEVSSQGSWTLPTGQSHRSYTDVSKQRNPTALEGHSLRISGATKHKTKQTYFLHHIYFFLGCICVFTVPIQSTFGLSLPRIPFAFSKAEMHWWLNTLIIP